MTVSMGMLIFAGLGYALEKDEPDTQFYTLPQTLYWAIITMTSTGERYTQFYTLPQTLYWAIITMTSTGERYVVRTPSSTFYTLPENICRQIRQLHTINLNLVAFLLHFLLHLYSVAPYSLWN